MPIPPSPRQIRVIGFDDAPHPHRRGAEVGLCGVVCSATRMEGMVWGRLRRDGWDATAGLTRALVGSRYASQVHAVLLDGVTFGGLNVVDLPALAAAVGVPCVAVMRRPPDLAAMRAAMERLPRPERRAAVLARAGEVHEVGGWTFNVVGLEAAATAELLDRVTDRGKVPEALRLAHLIGAAVCLGEGRGRA